MSKEYLVINEKGRSRRVSSRLISGVVTAATVLVVTATTSTWWGATLTKRNLELQQLLESKDELILQANSLNDELVDYINKIETELDGIRANFEIYKLEVAYETEKR